MKVLFIQLSDIHFNEQSNPFLNKKEQLFNAISNNTLDVKKIFFVISGDVAYSGKKEEYQIASDFLTELLLQIEIYSESDVEIIMIPGNHDCDFSENSMARENMIKSIQKLGDSIIDNSVIDILIRPQKNYFEFAKGFESKNSLLHSSELLSIYRYELEDKTLVINCFNSAYISELHEKPGQMYIPINFLNNELLSQKADLIITTFHHPLHWLNPDNRREFKGVVESISDIYITGHEHKNSKTLLSDLEGNNTLYIEGGVAQDTYNSDNSDFNLIFFDLSTDKFLLKNYHWDTDMYVSSSSEKWSSYEKSKVKLRNPYGLKNDFKSALNDIGANLSHPKASQVNLLDIYTFPRLELLSYTEDDVKNRVRYDQDSESLIDSLSNKIKLALTGPENIGKSALLKVIFLKLHSKGFVPILIDGKRINKTGIDDFKKIALEYFYTQYISTNEEYFHQLSKNKIVLLIDNFDKTSFNNKYKGRLLSNLLAHYNNIIVTGNELMSLEDFLSEDNAENTLVSNFKTYRIKEFGYFLKSKFINRWITLGSEETLSEEERIRKLTDAENIIKTVTGRNLVPNYPIFLLTILQAIELDNPTDLTASTFGHYYSFLIQKSFSRILKSQQDITSYNNYIGELAYHLFTNKIKSIDSKDLRKFDDLYREKYTISHNLNQIIDNLLTAKIFEEYNKNFEFKYLYIYYFFVSKYLADNISDDQIKNIIKALITRIHISEFANILLFLTHHTKDKFLLDEILLSATGLFEELGIFKLEPGNTAIDKLVSKLPKATYNVKSVNEHRDDVNIRKDEINEDEEDSEDDIEQTNDLYEDTSKLDTISKINLCFKMIEILGQVLKNNYGKIDNATLYNLVEQTYFLGLRTLNVFFSAIEKNIEGLINQIQIVVSERQVHDPKKIETVSKQILFAICSEIMYAFVKKVAESLGTQNLHNTYDTVVNKQAFNSVKLIDFSIRLDYFNQFPNNEMKKLREDFAKTPLATDVMRRMVIDYLYLFPTKAAQKQKILSFLDITMDAQRKIDFTSKSRKK